MLINSAGFSKGNGACERHNAHAAKKCRTKFLHLNAAQKTAPKSRKKCRTKMPHNSVDLNMVDMLDRFT